MKHTLLAALLAVTACLGTAAIGASAPQTYSSKPEYDSLFEQLVHTDVIVEGRARSTHVLYVFFDANCYYCNLTWKALRPYLKAGLQVRWVPVAYQQASSAGRAAAILAARDRVAALRANETKYNAAHYDGGIEPQAQVSAKLSASLADNTRLMQTFGAPGTPALVWKDPQGSIRFKVGMPRLSELPAITGLPEQKITDRELRVYR